ncbi:MAG: hypothetical protein HY349_02575, partial [Nitrospirae bacterium]|nr:hypothetical protein [Nitrospirota bacterium]
HDLQAGVERRINTGNGVTIAYAHTLRIEIKGLMKSACHLLEDNPLILLEADFKQGSGMVWIRPE